jgi:hypothetical protein
MARSKKSRTIKPEDGLRSIHRGIGIWEDDLHESMGERLRAIWGVPDNATPSRVREIVLLRLKAVLDTQVHPKLFVVVWTTYNLGVPTVSSGMAERLGRLSDDRPVGFSRSSCDRLFRSFLKVAERSLANEHPALEERDLRAAAGYLEANVRPDRGILLGSSSEGASLHNAIRALRAPADEPIRQFLTTPVHGPVTEAGALQVAELGKHGSWLCVFADKHLLDEYRCAAKANWPRTTRKNGREVILEAAGQTPLVGVLVNPSHQRGTGIEASLPLPPELIKRVAADL